MKKLLVIKLNEVRTAIQRSQNFRASNLMGLNYGDHGGYAVFSYATCIYSEAYDGEIIVNRLDEYFSRSTSRHQNIVKKALGIK